MLPTFLDFTCSPLRLHNVALVINDSALSGDHVLLGNDERVAITFEVSGDDLEQAVVSFVGLVSRLNPDEGYAPVTLSINDREFVRDYTVPGGGDIPQRCRFPLPSQWLHPGINTFALQVASDARSFFWLYHLAVDTAGDPENSEQARLIMAARTPLFTYRVEHGRGDVSTLTLFLDSGETALPSLLCWRDRKGNMASISFQSSMNDFIGYYQRPNEGPTAYRGLILNRQSAGQIARAGLEVPLTQPANTVFVYRTAHSWGGENSWHTAAPLAFSLDCGEESFPVNLSWRDQKNNTGSIGFVDDMSSFYGYYQRVGEGPIGYRGKLIKAFLLRELDSQR